MVKERAPPKVSSFETSSRENFDYDALDRFLDPDDVFNALISGNSSQSQGDINASFAPAPGPSRNPGHPGRLVSSRKQKADVFIRQKTRPEHHLDNGRVSGPRPPSYSDRPAPPLAMFDSNGPVRHQPARYVREEEVFYTDPNQASQDLKALLEGGMDGDDEDGVEGVQGAEDAENEETRDAGGEKKPQGEQSAKALDSQTVPKDGVVDGLKVQLLPHQVEGVNWMRGRELGPVKRGKVPRGGLLADDMGLGKTLQSISLILINTKPSKGAKGWKKAFEAVQNTTLVVAPLALIRQWEVEIKDKVASTRGLKVCVHHGPHRAKRSQDLQGYDIVITTYQILVSEHGQSATDDLALQVGCFGLHWWRVILDEAHTIKNRNAKATKACYALRSEYRWCLSGTPMQNNLDELQSLVRFLRIKPYEDLRQWKEQIEQPMKAGKGHIAIRRLHTLLRCFMKRRTKEILKEEGALNPGGKPTAEGEDSATGFRHTNRKVVTIAAEMDAAERKFYNALEERADKSMTNMMRNQINYANAFTILLRLRQACNHPKLLEKKLGAEMDEMLTGYNQISRSTKGADVDDVTELFSGMGISTRTCSICGCQITKDETASAQWHCVECAEDLATFVESPVKAKKPRKDKNKDRKHKERAKEKDKTRHRGQKHSGKTVKEEPADEEEEVAKKVRRLRHRNAIIDKDDDDDDEKDAKAIAKSSSKGARRPRNRNAVIDSDDEEGEGEGSWIVSGSERGDLHLGKAGGTDDENAEGVGDSIGSEDSGSEEEEGETVDGSSMGSFIVDDNEARVEEGYRSPGEAYDDDDDVDDDDDGLPSINALTKKMARHSLDEKTWAKMKGTKKATKKSPLSQEVISLSDSEDPPGISASASASASASDSDPSSDVSDSSSSEEEEQSSLSIPASAKIREMRKLLEAEAREHKFIVFSQFTTMLDLIEPFLRGMRLRFVRYDGSMKNDEREESLRRLREDQATRVLLCSLKCGSLGLNLTAATRVIIIEPFWNPFVEEQAIDRVHRLTQKTDVVVYKLTVKDTVEQGILDLQDKKRQLAEQTIEGGAKKSAVKLGLNEIIELFKPLHGAGRRNGNAAHQQDEDGNGGELEDGGLARDKAFLMRRAKVMRQAREESGVYGRRW